MYPCASRHSRSKMSDEDFWQDVARSLQGPDPEPDDDLSPDDVLQLGGPCPLCGAENACAWDADGRPLIHALHDLNALVPEEDQ